MKKFITIATTATLVATLLASCGGGKIAIKAGDVSANQGDIEMLTGAYEQSVGDFNTAKEYAVKSFEEAVKYCAAAKQKGIELSEDEQKQVKQGMANFKKSFGSVTEYKKALKKYGAKEADMELAIASSIYKNALKADVEAKEASDEELKQFFKDKYRRAKHVLMMCEGEDDGDEIKKKAQNVLNRAEQGQNFDELVKQFGEDPGMEQNPDGYVFTDNEMVNEFDDAVKSIKPGEFTLCKSTYGYHIIQRLPLDESDPKFNELFEQYKDTLKAAKAEASVDEEIDKILSDAGITVEKLDDVINAIPSPTPTAEPTEEPEGEATEGAETAEKAE